MPVVDVQQVRKVYHRDAQEITVLDGIDLQVPEGEFVALMGPSGSGKTTLLNLIAGIDRATSGKVQVAGTDLGRLSEQGRSEGDFLRRSEAAEPLQRHRGGQERQAEAGPEVRRLADGTGGAGDHPRLQGQRGRPVYPDRAASQLAGAG